MFEKILPGTKITSLAYDANRHTYLIRINDNVNPVLLSKTGIPSHVPLLFLDERVQILERVLVGIKSEKTLLSEGWKPYLKTSLKGPKSPFLIGKDKRSVLGTDQHGNIGITKDFKPYVFLNDGWRFGMNEIDYIIRLDCLPKTKDAAFNGFTYNSNASTLQLPYSGMVLGKKDIDSLKRVMQVAGII